MRETKIIDKSQIEIGADALKNGKLVVFPTETVYGLGADALNTEAVRSIFIAKGRPSDNPLIVHISDLGQLDQLVVNVSEVAKKLMAAFWPGPLTLVMEKSEIVPDIITAGLDTVAIRMPSDPIALELISKSGVPVAGPSANISGRPSPTSEEHVIQDLNHRVDVIIRGGNAIVGLESTVLDVTCDPPKILRPGYITDQDIKKIAGDVAFDPYLKDKNQVPKSPGMKYKHYSPDAEVIIIKGPKTLEKMSEIKESYEKKGQTIGIMATEEILSHFSGVTCSLGDEDDMEAVANQLFYCLRELDRKGVDMILTHAVQKQGLGIAIMNRLEKAAGYHIINTKEED